MPFGDKWRIQRAEYWDAMADRCDGLPINDVLAEEVLKRDSVIEIGCGAGHLASLFMSGGFRGRYWGCDISSAAVEAARLRVPAGAFDVGQFEHLAADGMVPNASVAVARSVIQHQAHWLPLVETALRYAPVVLLGIIRSIYFKETGRHEPRSRGTYFDVCISLEEMAREAADAGMSCVFTRTSGRLGPEVTIAITKC